MKRLIVVALLLVIALPLFGQRVSPQTDTISVSTRGIKFVCSWGATPLVPFFPRQTTSFDTLTIPYTSDYGRVVETYNASTADTVYLSYTQNYPNKQLVWTEKVLPGAVAFRDFNGAWITRVFIKSSGASTATFVKIYN
jgi:hypothetical protein